MKIFNLKELKPFRRELRNNPTPQEIVLWSRLRRNKLGYKFRRQYGIDNYIVDFCCLKKKIIIEIDGSHHNEDETKMYDKNRTKTLENLGFRVLRFWNNDISTNLNGVIEKISHYL